MNTTYNIEPYDPYELMITPPNNKGDMIVRELEKPEPNQSIVRDLITLGANLDWQGNDGWTALHWCVDWNHSRIARMLIDAGADVNIQHNNGSTALHWCAIKNRPEISKMLLDAGADKTIPTNNGKLPYELAKTQELKKLLQP